MPDPAVAKAAPADVRRERRVMSLRGMLHPFLGFMALIIALLVEISSKEA